MWRLWNKLFGWDYVYWESPLGGHCIISRIYVTGNGIPYFTAFKYAGYLYKLENCLDSVLWLTCKPEKYLKIGTITSLDRGRYRPTPLHTDCGEPVTK